MDAAVNLLFIRFLICWFCFFPFSIHRAFCCVLRRIQPPQSSGFTLISNRHGLFLQVLVAVLSDYPGEVLLVLFIQILTVYLRVGEVVERLIHQLGKKATLFAAQDAYPDASGQDIGDGLGDLFDQAEGCAGFSVHSAIPFFAPPSMTPPCRRFTRLMPAAMASSDTVNISVTFWLPVWV